MAQSKSPKSNSTNRSLSLASPNVGLSDVYFAQKVQHCAARAEGAVDSEMRESWTRAAAAWRAAAHLIERANVVIREWETAGYDDLPRREQPRRITLPACSGCGKTMQFAGVESHHVYSNLYHRIFTCRCGERLDQVVTRSG
jgi:hypothetical protein